jgi:hypothetical protein
MEKEPKIDKNSARRNVGGIDYELAKSILVTFSCSEASYH